MIIPQEGQMNYETIDDLAFYYMFVSACLSDEKRRVLRLKWNETGAYEVTPWWKFVMENTKVDIDIK